MPWRKMYAFKEARDQAAQYDRKLGLSEINLVIFVEAIDDANRKKFEVDYMDEPTGVKVRPIFVEVGR